MGVGGWGLGVGGWGLGVQTCSDRWAKKHWERRGGGREARQAALRGEGEGGEGEAGGVGVGGKGEGGGVKSGVTSDV